MKMIRLLIKVSLIAGGVLLLGFVVLLIYVLYTQHRYNNLADTHDLKSRINKMGSEYVGRRTNPPW